MPACSLLGASLRPLFEGSLIVHPENSRSRQELSGDLGYFGAGV